MNSRNCFFSIEFVELSNVYFGVSTDTRIMSSNIPICWLYVSMQVQYYERLSPLVPLKTTLGSFSNIKAGDCVVTFSRRSIYMLKVGILQITVAEYTEIISI